MERERRRRSAKCRVTTEPAAAVGRYKPVYMGLHLNQVLSCGPGIQFLAPFLYLCFLFYLVYLIDRAAVLRESQRESAGEGRVITEPAAAVGRYKPLYILTKCYPVPQESNF